MLPEEFKLIQAQLNAIQASVQPKRCNIDFIKYARKHIARIREQERIGTAQNLKRSINHFSRYRQRIPISDITTTILLQFQEYLQNKVSKDTIQAYLIDVRTIY